MTIEIKVPPLPESVTDATLISWHKNVGDKVTRDENLVDLETDKVVLEVPSPKTGVLDKILVEGSSIVKSGDILAIMTEGQINSIPAQDAGDANKNNDIKVNAKDKAIIQDSVKKTSPAVKKLLEEHDLEASMIKSSKKNGRLTKSDVLNYLRSKDAENSTTNDIERPIDKTKKEKVEQHELGDQRVPMTRLRAKIAERMVEAQANAAMLTSFNEIDLHEVMELRKKYKESFFAEHSIKLGLMSFFNRFNTASPALDESLFLSSDMAS